MAGMDLDREDLHMAGGRVPTPVHPDESSIVRLSGDRKPVKEKWMAMVMVTPAAAEEHDGGGDPDEDEDGRAHPDANHCLDRQHLGVRMKKMILSDKGMDDSGSLTLCL